MATVCRGNAIQPGVMRFCKKISKDDNRVGLDPDPAVGSLVRNKVTTLTLSGLDVGGIPLFTCAGESYRGRRRWCGLGRGSPRTVPLFVLLSLGIAEGDGMQGGWVRGCGRPRRDPSGGGSA